MTTKEAHVLNFWYAKLSELNCGRSDYVSAGKLAEYTGQSRTTAQKYLKRMVGEGKVVTDERPHRNGLMATVYHVNEGNFA